MRVTSCVLNMLPICNRYSHIFMSSVPVWTHFFLVYVQRFHTHSSCVYVCRAMHLVPSFLVSYGHRDLGHTGMW